MAETSFAGIYAEGPATTPKADSSGRESLVPMPAGPGRITLPRRSGESPFGPAPYYYPASRSGVVPSEVFNR